MDSTKVCFISKFVLFLLHPLSCPPPRQSPPIQPANIVSSQETVVEWSSQKETWAHWNPGRNLNALNIMQRFLERRKEGGKEEERGKKKKKT